MLWEKEENDIVCEMKDTINYDRMAAGELGEFVYGWGKSESEA